MVSDLDFKGVLEDIKDHDLADRTLDQATGGNLDVIKTALRIADRLQRGDIGESTIAIAYSKSNTYFESGHRNCNLFREMSKQLIRECSDGK